MGGLLLRAGRRLFDLTVAALPGWLRRRAGDGMRRTFAERQERLLASRGTLALLGLTVAEVLAVVRLALRGHLRGRALLALGDSGSADAGATPPLHKGTSNHSRSVSRMIEETVQDLRLAIRGLMRSPTFTVVAVLTLALAIGINTTIFSVVNAVLLKPLPVDRPEELVEVYTGDEDLDTGSGSYPNYLDLRREATSLEGLVAFSNFFASFTVEGRPEVVLGEVVSDNYFDVLGIEPGLGRAFRPEEFAVEGGGRVVILGHAFWRSRFGGDPEVLGRTIRLNGTTYEVVGVAPERFPGMFPALAAQMWIPLTMVEEVEPVGIQASAPSPTGDTRLTRRGQRWLWIRGRLADGVDLPSAQAELRGLMDRLVEEYPVANEGLRVHVVPSSGVRFNPALDANLVPAAALLVGIVALVLLVACANIANMLLARARSRRREIAIRLALGAGRGRILRKLLTESLVVATLGSGAGLLLTLWATGALTTLETPLPVALSFDFGIDARVLLFTLLVTVATGIAFGLAPALQTSRPALVPDLKGAAETARPGRLEARDALVVAQVAICLVLLVGGTLLGRSVLSAREIDLGFDADRLAYLALGVEMSGRSAEQGPRIFRQGLVRLEALPGVVAASVASRVPLDINRSLERVLLQGVHESRDEDGVSLDSLRVEVGYFETVGAEVLRGRVFEDADLEEGRRVVVVNQALASTYWPGESAVGKRIRDDRDSEPHRVIGVVETQKFNTVGEPPTPRIVYPMSRRSRGYGIFVVRTRESAAEQLPRLRQAVLEVDPELVFLDVGPLNDVVATSLLPVRLGAVLVAAFGGLALLLAAVGLYGVIGYSVSRRTREIGVRKALGAAAPRVLGLVVGRGMRLVGIGGAIGLVLAAAASRLLSGVLYGISPLDPLSFGVAAVVLAAIGLVANLMPARRATRIDPMQALRSE